MPELDGFETIAAIRAREDGTEAHIPVIALTAHAMKGDRDRCLNSGFDGYLTKPFRAHELVRTIEDFAKAGLMDLQDDETEPGDVVFNYQVALESTGGDREFFDEIARIFLDDVPRLRKQIGDALGQNDSEALCRAVHTLKGAAGYFAVPSVIDAAKAVELKAQSGDLAGVGSVLTALEQSLDRILPALRESLLQPIAV
jgi:CheY-like chemotaxis protein